MLGNTASCSEILVVFFAFVLFSLGCIMSVVEFEVLSVVAMKSSTFWDVALHSLFCPEGGGSTFLQNVGKFLCSYVVLHSRRFYTSSCHTLAEL